MRDVDGPLWTAKKCMTRMRSGVRLPLRPPVLSRDFFPAGALSEPPKTPAVRAMCAIETRDGRGATFASVRLSGVRDLRQPGQHGIHVDCFLRDRPDRAVLVALAGLGATVSLSAIPAIPVPGQGRRTRRATSTTRTAGFGGSPRASPPTLLDVRAP